MTFPFTIIVPDAVVLDTRAHSVEAADATGRFGIRPGHEPFITVLVPALLTYTIEQGTEHFAAIDGGVLSFENGRLTVATREAVLADRLEDLAAQAQAILDARVRQEKRECAEFDELQTVLVKQLAKLGKGS